MHDTPAEEKMIISPSLRGPISIYFFAISCHFLLSLETFGCSPCSKPNCNGIVLVSWVWLVIIGRKLRACF
jgi:hypothetical protein